MTKSKTQVAYAQSEDRRAVGDRVLYVLQNGARRGEVRPAAVTRIDADGRINLSVQTDAGDELPPVLLVADCQPGVYRLVKD